MRKNKVITLLYSCWKLFFLFLQTHINTHVCIHICTQSGSFPLYYASGEGHDGIVKMLLQKGATVDMQTKIGIVCVASILDPPKKTHPHPPTQMHTQAYGKVLQNHACTCLCNSDLFILNSIFWFLEFTQCLKHVAHVHQHVKSIATFP